MYRWLIKPEDDDKKDLYDRVEKFFMGVVRAKVSVLKQKHGEELLKEYHTAFGSFTTATAMIHKLFAYMVSL